MLIQFVCLDGHTWEVRFDRNGALCWALIEMNPDSEETEREVRSAGLSAYDQRRAVDVLEMEIAEDRRAA